MDKYHNNFPTSMADAIYGVNVKIKWERKKKRGKIIFTTFKFSRFLPRRDAPPPPDPAGPLWVHYNNMRCMGVHYIRDVWGYIMIRDVWLPRENIDRRLEGLKGKRNKRFSKSGDGGEGMDQRISIMKKMS
jgi:hypothetical protein